MSFYKIHKLTRGHFPDSKKQFFIFVGTVVPVLLSTLLFSFNNFVDNFQVTGIDGGVAALGLANTWTAIVTACFIAIAYVSVSTFSQFQGAGLYKQARDSIKFRWILMVFVAFTFIISANSAPRKFITLFGPGQREIVIAQGVEYLQLVSIAWFLFAFSTISGNVMRQVGHVKLSLAASAGALIVNVVFNLVFINILHLGVAGAAGATILARVLSSLFNGTYLFRMHPELRIKPWRIFIIDKQVWEISKKRVKVAIFVFVSQFTLVARIIFWNQRYRAGSVGANTFSQLDIANASVLIGLSAASVLGIVTAISNIILSAINSADTITSIFVAQELGRNHIALAKRNARQLKGFNLLIGLLFSLVGLIVIIITPYATSFAGGRFEAISNNSSLGDANTRLILATAAQNELLRQIQLCLIPPTVLSPVWIWYVTSSKSMSTGRFNQKWALIEFSINLAQFCWLLIVAYTLNTTLDFWQAYMLFFTSGLMKLIVYEFVFYHADWATSITNFETPERKTKVHHLLRNKALFKKTLAVFLKPSLVQKTF